METSSTSTKTNSSNPTKSPSTLHHVLGTPVFPQSHLSSLKQKAVLVAPSTKPELESGIYRSALNPKELVKDFPGIQTFYEMFNNSVQHYGNLNCLGTRHPVSDTGGWSEYKWKTYNEVNRDRIWFGAGLMAIHDLNVNANANANSNWLLGIYAANRYEWVVSDLGAGCYSVPTVSLYDTLGPQTSEFIINHSELPIIITSVDKVANLLSLAPKCPTLKVVIVMESVVKPHNTAIPILQKWGAQVGITVVSFAEVLDIGRKNTRPHVPPKSEDLCLISYTSGTTGNPKGAMISHNNIISSLRAGSLFLSLDPTDVHISYLPLAHIFERVVLSNMLFIGGSAGFFRGDVALLIDDISVLKPTFFVSVPRLFNRIYDKIMQGALSGSPIKAALFTRALDAKLYHLKNGGHLQHSVWDPLVFSKVKAVLGGRVRIMLSGSAPISSAVVNFMRVATGAQFIEGYGQTETCAGLTISWPGDFDAGHVGCVQANLELKLVSVPEMGYHAKDLKGEVVVRGNGVFLGYLKDEKKTKEAINEEGWLATGDIGTLDKQGRLSIVDRKKNIFKLAQGEYIAPEKLEGTFLKSNFVAQIYVHGDSLQSELVGIVVPDQEYCIKWAMENGVLPGNTVVPPPPVPNAPLHPLVKTVAESSKFVAAVLKDLDAMGKKDKLRGFEFIKAVHIHHDLFSAESGLLTPTFKLKRNEAAAAFRPQIDAMYKHLESVRPPAKL